MKNFLLPVLGALILTTSTVSAQDYPLKSERPQPYSATLVGVCEDRLPKLMVAVFTYENGKVLRVDGKNMQGFTSAQEIVQYAATSKTEPADYAQNCGDATT